MITPFYFYYGKKNEVITFTIHVLIDLILLEKGIHLSKANDSTNPFSLLFGYPSQDGEQMKGL